MEKNKTICSKCGDEYDTYRDGECQTCEVEEEYEILGKPCTEPEPVEWEKEFFECQPTRDMNFTGAESEHSKFGYKTRRANEIFTVVDWGNIKQFISTQIAKARKEGAEDERKEVLEEIVFARTNMTDKELLSFIKNWN